MHLCHFLSGFLKKSTMSTTVSSTAKCVAASLTVAFVFAFVSAELPLPEGYAVFKIQQKGVCSTVYCPWYCDRYIDANGCVYCGKCTKPLPYTCPTISCPSLPHFDCTTRRGQDGCNVCKCRQIKQRPLAALVSADAVNASPVKTSRQCPGPAPLCSRRCYIEKDENGCDRCSCPAVAAAAMLTGPSPPANYTPYPLSRKPPYPSSPCPEAPNAPCPRPGVCWRERGADGCYSCRCRDDVAVCPEIKCDFPRCQHVIDQVTGCATGCQCGNGQRNDV